MDTNKLLIIIFHLIIGGLIFYIGYHGKTYNNYCCCEIEAIDKHFADKKSKDNIYKSVRNIPNVKVTDVNHFSAYDIIKFKKVVFTESSVKELEKRYS